MIAQDLEFIFQSLMPRTKIQICHHGDMPGCDPNKLLYFKSFIGSSLYRDGGLSKGLSAATTAIGFNHITSIRVQPSNEAPCTPGLL